MATFNFKAILDQAEEENFLHPEGKKIPASIVDAVYKVSSSGNEMLVIRAKVTGGPNAGKGRPLFGYIMLGNSAGIQQLFNMGVKKGTLSAMDGRDTEEVWNVVAAELANRPVKIDIRHDTYQGQKNAKVSWVNPADGATGPKPQTQPEVRSNGSGEESELERMRRELEEEKAKSAPRRSAPPDDLPF